MTEAERYEGKLAKSANKNKRNPQEEWMNIVSSFPLNDTTYTYNTAISDIQRYTFQVEAHASNGEISYSNPVFYKIPATFFVASGFTPNDDGLNDKVIVQGKFISEIEMLIYNRWGNLVFRTDDIAIGWDGYIQDRLAPQGSYSYILTVKDPYDETYTKSGIINLIR